MKIFSSFVFLALLSLQESVQCEILMLPDALYYNLTKYSRADLFAAQNQRQYNAITKEFDTHLINFKQLYTKRIEVLHNNEELLESKLNELEHKLNPYEILNDMSNYCVQKYRAKVPILTTLKTNFAKCMQTANSAYPPIVSAAEATVRNLKNYYTGTHANGVNDCKKKFEHMESNYTQCVMNVVKTTTTVTNTNTHTFNSHMKTAACTADLKVREAFDCHANVLYTGLGAISEVLALVENCMAGNELCPTCGDESDLQKGRCPYQMSWHLADNDFNSEKITNPFKGISSTTPCLQINFINKTVQLV